MTPVSKRKLNKTNEKLFNSALIYIFNNLDKNGVVNVLNSLLTQTEIKMLKKRVGILLLQQSGFTQEEISEATKTTHQTIINISTTQALIGKTKSITVQDRLKKFSRLESYKAFVTTLRNIDISRSTIRKKISPF